MAFFKYCQESSKSVADTILALFRYHFFNLFMYLTHCDLGIESAISPMESENFRLPHSNQISVLLFFVVVVLLNVQFLKITEYSQEMTQQLINNSYMYDSLGNLKKHVTCHMTLSNNNSDVA